jgi:hypothetical protein
MTASSWLRPILRDRDTHCRSRSSDVSARSASATRTVQVLASEHRAKYLERLREQADEHESVALLIVDHSMSDMPGVESLARA